MCKARNACDDCVEKAKSTESDEDYVDLLPTPKPESLQTRNRRVGGENAIEKVGLTVALFGRGGCTSGREDEGWFEEGEQVRGRQRNDDKGRDQGGGRACGCQNRRRR